MGHRKYSWHLGGSPSLVVKGGDQGTLKREYSAQSKQCAHDTNAFQTMALALTKMFKQISSFSQKFIFLLPQKHRNNHEKL